jgi:hypothetical protein
MNSRNYLENAIHLIIEDDPCIFWSYTKYLNYNELTSITLLKAVLISGNIEFISKFIGRYHPAKVIVEDDLFECLISYCYPRVVRFFKNHINSVILKYPLEVATNLSFVLFRLFNAPISRDNVSAFKNIRILQDSINHNNIINAIIQNIDKNHKGNDVKSYKKYLSKNLLVHVGLLKKNLCYVKCDDYYNYLLNFHKSRDIYESYEIEDRKSLNDLRKKIDEDLKFIMDFSEEKNKNKEEFENNIKRHNIVFKMLKNLATNLVMNGYF